jgi:hypothetical protein|tara:strand:+ start:138 stop:377 length:240 start_codon:yes stop_codon:yes gene_type:complete
MIIISFEKEFNSRKLKLFKSYIEELTVFINVRIPNLKDSSKFIPNIESSDVIVNTEIINTNTERKYLFISFCSILESIK